MIGHIRAANNRAAAHAFNREVKEREEALRIDIHKALREKEQSSK